MLNVNQKGVEVIFKLDFIFSSLTESEKIEFPAITIFRKYTFNHASNALYQTMDSWRNQSQAFVKNWVLNNTHSIEKVFRFVQHRTEQREFPCDVVESPRLPGAPCSFQFNTGDCGIANILNPLKSHRCRSFNETSNLLVNNNCTTERDSRPWCSVRVYKNQSAILGAYGYCREKCQGQRPDQNQPAYLAGQQFSHLWKTQMFSLNGWKSGHCYTYMPDELYLPGSDGNFYALLEDGFKEIDQLGGYNVYLHPDKVFKKCLFYTNNEMYITRLLGRRALSANLLFPLQCENVLFVYIVNKTQNFADFMKKIYGFSKKF